MDQNPSVSTEVATAAFVTLVTRIAITAQNTALWHKCWTESALRSKDSPKQPIYLEKNPANV